MPWELHHKQNGKKKSIDQIAIIKTYSSKLVDPGSASHPRTEAKDKHEGRIQKQGALD